MADDQTQEAAPAAKKPGLLENKMVMIAVLVVLQGAMAFGATKFLIAPAARPSEVATAEDGEEEGAQARQRGVLVSLEEMIVSLNSSGRPRYLRTNISVEAVDAGIAEVVAERMAQFRDAAIMSLSNHLAEDLMSFEGKESVKAEIKEVIQDLMDEGQILNVYYSDFVVQ